MNWSEEQVLSLSPDASSTKSGKDLAKPAKWVTLGNNENALWGECQGSGSKPYRTQIDIKNIAFKCSCPSRKFPCKHGLGLMLLFSRSPELFSTSDAPDWVTEWLAKRNEREEKKTEKKDKPVDEAAQTKRQLARHQKVQDGIEELLLWIKDIIRNGLLYLPEKQLSFWENTTKRLVDAQAPGLANMVRLLSESNFYGDNWQSGFMDQLLKLYLVARGYQNLTSLPESLQQDIKSYIGFTHNQEELKEQSGISDVWLVLGKQSTEEDNLTVDRFWLYGTGTQRYALILQFVFKGQGATLALSPGTAVEAELVYYPSAAPLRAVIKNQMNTKAAGRIKGLADLAAVAAEETKTAAVLPFKGDRVYIVENLRPVVVNTIFYLADRNNQLAMLHPEFTNHYQLLAVSGGRPATIAVVGQENTFTPVGLTDGQRYFIL